MASLEEIACQQNQRDQHQKHRNVAGSGRRRPELGSVIARSRESPHDQNQADCRNERIDSFPRALAEASDRSFAAALGDDAGRMKAKKDDEAEDQNRHGQSALRREAFAEREG
jgi:hypothetical protein